jgi:PQQ-dependent catabolism-associated beta-propeller protein
VSGNGASVSRERVAVGRRFLFAALGGITLRKFQRRSASPQPGFLLYRVMTSMHMMRGWAAAALVVLLLTLPRSASAKDTGRIFVSNERSNNLIVLDPRSLKLVKDLPTAGRPRDMHFNADHTLLYVACGDDDVIDVIDVAKLAVVRQIATGRSPEAFAIDEARQRLYVSNEENSSLSIIDMAQNVTIKEVSTGAEPEGVLLSADKSTLYVTSEVDDLVHVIKADDGFVSDNIVTGTRPRRFAATPDGKELWVSTELSGEVWIIDRKTDATIDHITFLPPGMRKTDVTPVGLAMTADGKTAFITLGHANHVACVDVASRKVTAYVLVGDRAWGVALSRDEKTLYVANGLGDDMTVVDVASRKATASVPVGRTPYAIAIDD